METEDYGWDFAMLTREEVLQTRPDNAYLAVGDIRAANQLVLDLQLGGTASYWVRGDWCASETDLFREWSAALQFPYYFGFNWDAFNECVNDLDWLLVPEVIIVVANADLILRDEPDEQKIFLDIMRTLGSERQMDEPASHAVFHCVRGHEQRTLTTFETAGIKLRVRPIGS